MQAKETDRINARVQHDVKVRAQIERKTDSQFQYLRIVLTSVANNGLLNTLHNLNRKLSIQL